MSQKLWRVSYVDERHKPALAGVTLIFFIYSRDPSIVCGRGEFKG
jgi:hypothetical protein